MTSNGDKFSNENCLCEIWGSHICVAKDASLLGYDDVLLGEWFMFREFEVPSSGKERSKKYLTPKQTTATLRNVGNYSHPTGQRHIPHSSNPPNRLLATRFLDCRTQYRGDNKSLVRPEWKQASKHVRDARDLNNIEARVVIKFFPPARQGAEGNSRHSDKH